MLTRLAWLGLEVTAMAASERFYGELLGLDEIDRGRGRTYAVGDTELRLRAERGGRHVHYAFSTAPEAYEDWRERIGEHRSVEEHDFGVYRSLYCFDPNEHCVEIGGRGGDSSALSGIFEIVLEVASLERATQLYRVFDTEVIDRGTERRRIRLDVGPFELELWEPQYGLAGARGGEDVDLGLVVADLDEVVDRLEGAAGDLEWVDGGCRLVDIDGHALTLLDD